MTDINNVRRRNKSVLVSFFGGCCEICGYSKSLRALQFHHIERSSKEFAISEFAVVHSLKRMLEEAKKCLLLCANCHAEVEEFTTTVPLQILDRTTVIRKIDEWLITQIKSENPIVLCEVCGEGIMHNSRSPRYCSIKCSNRGRQKVSRPDDDTLLSLIDEKGYEGVGRLYGVTGNAVKKWHKRIQWIA